MVNRIRQKLRGAAGASIIMALSIMMVVAALSASMLSIAITAPQVAFEQQQYEQDYLAVTSAARLLQKIFNDASDMTDKTKIIDALNNSTVLVSGYHKTLTLKVTPDALQDKFNVEIVLTKSDDPTKATATIYAPSKDSARYTYPLPQPLDISSDPEP